MMYFLEIKEGNYRIPIGRPLGYASIEEAKKEAEKHVDDALPRNRARVLCHVATAYWRGLAVAVSDEK